MINSYPNRYKFNSLNELNEILQNKKFKNLENQIGVWIEDNAGPLPPEDFPIRVLNIIQSII